MLSVQLHNLVSGIGIKVGPIDEGYRNCLIEDLKSCRDTARALEKRVGLTKKMRVSNKLDSIINVLSMLKKSPNCFFVNALITDLKSCLKTAKLFEDNILIVTMIETSYVFDISELV